MSMHSDHSSNPLFSGIDRWSCEEWIQCCPSIDVSEDIRVRNVSWRFMRRRILLSEGEYSWQRREWNSHIRLGTHHTRRVRGAPFDISSTFDLLLEYSNSWPYAANFFGGGEGGGKLSIHRRTNSFLDNVLGVFCSWQEVSHVFDGYSRPARFVRFEHGGKDDKVWRRSQRSFQLEAGGLVLARCLSGLE